VDAAQADRQQGGDAVSRFVVNPTARPLVVGTDTARGQAPGRVHILTDGSDGPCRKIAVAMFADDAEAIARAFNAHDELLAFAIRVAEFGDYTHDEVDEKKILHELQCAAAALVAKVEQT
jgi:hypothetical protein